MKSHRFSLWWCQTDSFLPTVPTQCKSNYPIRRLLKGKADYCTDVIVSSLLTVRWSATICHSQSCMCLLSRMLSLRTSSHPPLSLPDTRRRSCLCPVSSQVWTEHGNLSDWWNAKECFSAAEVHSHSLCRKYLHRCCL